MRNTTLSVATGRRDAQCKGSTLESFRPQQSHELSCLCWPSCPERQSRHRRTQVSVALRKQCPFRSKWTPVRLSRKEKAQASGERKASLKAERQGSPKREAQPRCQLISRPFGHCRKASHVFSKVSSRCQRSVSSISFFVIRSARF